MLLARTNFDVPKHKGISWFAFKLDQPGVTIRPLREMTGDDIFNEIFLDEAVVDDADLIGGEGNGWMVTQTTLHFERTGIGAGGGMAGFPFPGPKGGMLGRRAGDAALDQPADAKLTLGFDDVVGAGHASSAAPTTRTCARSCRASTPTRMTGLWNAQRGKAEAERGGGQALGSIAKLTQTRIVKRAAGLATAISGAHGTLAGRRRPRRRRVQQGDGVLAGVVDLRRHRRDPAQHRRRAHPRAARGAGSRPGPPLRRGPPGPHQV